MVKGGVSKGSRDVRVFDGSEIPESPEIESRIGGRQIGKGEVTRSGVRREEGKGAHCGARNKRRGDNLSEDLLRSQTSSLCNRCRGLVP